MRYRPVYALLPLLTLFLLIGLLLCPLDRANAEIVLAKGQTVYVPVYSHIYSGPRKKPFQLSATLSIRSTDFTTPFRITAIDYYDTDGRLVRRYAPRSIVVSPMASNHVHIDQNDVSGGFGANFIVRWEADRPINTPVIECVMIGSTIGQGISFVSSGQPIRDPAP